MRKYKLGFIGCGNMAKAIIKGLQSTETVEQIAVYDVNLQACVSIVGVHCCESMKDIVSSCDTVLIAVKPFHSKDVFEQMREHVQSDQMLISIMAGVRIATMEAQSGFRKIIRVMPNLAAQRLKSMSALAFNDNITKTDQSFAEQVFRGVGETVCVVEDDLDAVTAVSGSGPAYVYEFLQHFILGGMACGLDAAVAKQLVLATVRGACEMVEHAEQPIAEMTDAVCSKGGTTIEAVKVLREEKFGETLERAMNACYRRSLEMSGKA